MAETKWPEPENMSLPQTGVDSHAHLDSDKLWPDFTAVLQRAGQAGLQRIGQVFLNHAAYLDKIEMMAEHPELFFLLGIHPSDGHLAAPDEWDSLARDFSTDNRLRAVGEIGLDFYWKDCPRELQDGIFRLQLRMARTQDRPVVIHSRDAFTETINILDAEGWLGGPLLWHCFGGNKEQAAEIIKRGWHISIPGAVTYPANSALREAVAEIPIDRLMVETDCPYLSPQQWRGRRNEPALSVFTAQAVAQAKGMDTVELWTLCGHTALRFFGL